MFAGCLNEDGEWMAVWRWISGEDVTGNGIIFGAAMAEKRLENSKVRYSAAYPTRADRSAKRTSSPWGLHSIHSFN